MKWPTFSFPTSSSGNGLSGRCLSGESGQCGRFDLKTYIEKSFKVVFATISWGFVSWREQESRYLESTRDRLQTQLKFLYGPLHANRHGFTVRD